MVDLETLGTRGDTAFLSIGAVAFDPFSDGVPFGGQRAFYRNVDAQSCIDLGLRVDGSTVMWWFGKEDAARRALTDPRPEPVGQVLSAFSSWYKSHAVRYKTCVWSHGATFDIPIISEAYARIGHKPPWEFWDCNDTRTVFRLAGAKLPNADTRGGGHNALNDCVAQAEHLQRCIAMLRGRSVNSSTQGSIDASSTPDSPAAEPEELVL
jgi:hypothetical protein